MTLPSHSTLARSLERAVRQEMTAWGIGGLALALVDGPETVYAAGFGQAQRQSVFRCGSLSKLFNAVAVVQLVEQGKLDLDAPVDRYAPGLLPVNPFAQSAPVTLRQLLTHRSGMSRETPVGGYFDHSQPGLARTLSSLAQTVLLNPPNTKTRYSNVGPSLAGHLVERAAGLGFEEYQRERILAPLGMDHSSWRLEAVPPHQLVPAFMRVADGRGGFARRQAPVFNLGAVPAGNLFTTAEDLARFLSMLAAGGQGPGGRILKAESLARMFAPQPPGAPGAYGLGFVRADFRELQAVGHNGAVYGHSASLLFLPEAKVGVVVLANEDLVNARTQKLAQAALSLLLAAKGREGPPPAPAPVRLSRNALAAFRGDYESESLWAKLRIRDGHLAANISGQPATLTPLGQGRFVAESRVNASAPVDFLRDAASQVTGFTLGPQEFRRVPSRRDEIPEAWHCYLGSFGPACIPLVLSQRHGHLYAMTENLADYRLTPLNRRVFAFPPGLYADEHLVFLAEGRGQTPRVDMANMVLSRVSP